MKYLAIITTHPIQYNAPWFRLLAERKKLYVKVFYTWGQSANANKYDPGFGKVVEWDIPLLDGYDYTFVDNISADPGSHHYEGINTPSLIKEIESWHPDAILVFGWNFKSHLQCLRYFHKKLPVFFRGDSIPGRQKGIKSFIRIFVLRWVYSHVDKALYVGQENKRYFLQSGLRNDQLVFAPHAIDNLRFSDPNGSYTREASEWRIQLGIKENELVLLYAGKLEPIKNLEWLVESVKGAPDLPIKLVIVGNGPLEEGLRSKSLGDSRIIFLNFQNQQKMPVVYRLGDVVVLCSHSETWGLAVNEAMASGRAILVSDSVGSAKDLVENDRNGFIFQTSNTEDFVEKISKFVKNKELIINMGKQSAYLISEWSYENICSQVEYVVNNTTK